MVRKQGVHKNVDRSWACTTMEM